MSTSTMDNLDQLLLDRLKSRDESLDSGTSRIVNSHSNLLGSVIGLRARCQELEDSVEELYAENAELRCDKSLTSATTAASEEQLMETIKAQKELSSLLRSQGDKKQEIISLKDRIEEFESELRKKDLILKEKEKRLEKLKREQIILEAKFEELANSNQLMKDEQQAFCLEFTCLQQKHAKLTCDHEELVQRWPKMRDNVTEEEQAVTHLVQKRQQEIRTQLLEAAGAEFDVPELPCPCVPRNTS